ncbi:cuticle protein 7-like [Rhynchophorus ferrugineus]|uniref:cuticle protein 7-like n=1 Tax=Rhynchophorus ferrugineus TaxID=354439 RepID=UPI003FCCB329
MNSFSFTLWLTVAVAAVLAYPEGHGDDGHHQVPHYHFEYGVHDPHTKDHKSQDEHRHHDDVKGGYTIHDPDGTHRVVKYTSDHKGGFTAEVHREGHAQHPAHYGKHGEHGGEGGTSYVGVTHWGKGAGK